MSGQLRFRGLLEQLVVSGLLTTLIKLNVHRERKRPRMNAAGDTDLSDSMRYMLAHYESLHQSEPIASGGPPFESPREHVDE